MKASSHALPTPLGPITDGQLAAISDLVRSPDLTEAEALPFRYRHAVESCGYEGTFAQYSQLARLVDCLAGLYEQGVAEGKQEATP